MPSYGVSITVDTASPRIAALLDGLSRQTYLSPIGRAGTRKLKDHFAAKNLSPDTHATANKLGARPLNLFAQFARSTQHQVEGRNVILSVNHVAARQRYHGGTITPINRKYLTIPAVAQAYGFRAREFPQLIPLIRTIGGKKRAVALVMPEGQVEIKAGKQKGKTILREKKLQAGIWYWLVTSVTQAPDPTVLPPEQDLVDAILAGLTEWKDNILKER